jgi:hypothetical protein
MPTSITVRVQARGGKFLADDVGGAEVAVHDAHTGALLGSGVVRGTSSGNLSGSYQTGASLSTIVTPGDPPMVRWLVPDSDTSRLTLELPLVRPTLLVFSAFAPLGGLQTAQRVTATQWAVPGQVIDQGAGFVLGLPGLLVQVQRPATHLAITSLPYVVDFEANVAMMCGCPIADSQPGNPSPWIPSDFEVCARIDRAGQGTVADVSLTFPGTAPSRFTGSWKVTEPGYYQATVTAVQRSTGNTGCGMVTFFTKLPSG